MRYQLMPAARPSGYGEAIVTMAQVKAHCRIDHDDDDDLLHALRGAAIDLVEQYTAVRMGPTPDIEWRGEALCGSVALGVRPITAVTAIDYLDANGVAQTVDTATVRVGVHDQIAPIPGQSWPSDVAGAVSVTFDAGFAAGSCPDALIAAVLRMIATLYDARDSLVTDGMAAEVPMGVRMLCSPYRMRRV